MLVVKPHLKTFPHILLDRPLAQHFVVTSMSWYKETEGIKMHCCLPNRIYKRKEVDRKANKISSYAEQAKQDCNIEYILTTTLVSPPDFLFIHFSKV